MKDRDLPAAVVLRAFQKLGCDAEIEGGYLTVRRMAHGRTLVAKQHLHKGERDTLRRLALRTIYRHRLQFTPEEFYAAVVDVE